MRLLASYCGHLPIGDYAGYNTVAAHAEIERLAFWAHTRHEFAEA
ncbi:transposase IS66 [Pseudomonas sp. ATCC 13867]|nr:transposase IS66 [Pseudomonas sp. ATCC 13867]